MAPDTVSGKAQTSSLSSPPASQDLFSPDVIEYIAEPEPPPEDLWERIRDGLSWQEIHNDQVDRARRDYLRQHDYLQVIASRANYYLYYIVGEVERRGMPMEIALLPLVESTLDPFAYSSESAAGLWQIMPATGRHLGLEQDWWFDGRRDLRASTHAALDYLESLHRHFEEDWLLALAAYNSGKTRVRRARKSNLQRGQGADYWSLRLPRETRHYVPKLIALSQIISSPERYGAVIPPVPNSPAFEIADTGGQIELARAAELADVAFDTLRALNPGHLRWATAPERPPELLLPVGAAARFTEAVANLSPEERVRWQYYRIEPGDSLIRIARKFDTEVALLRAANSIRGSMIRAGDTLMIPMGSGWEASLAMAGGEPQVKGYRVRRGDSLYRIAGKFNVSINDIIAWNALDPGKYLQPGQTLTLYIDGS
jgi:membrane-bound lytic murein transglycosylase D